jgi:hypothetical protein
MIIKSLTHQVPLHLASAGFVLRRQRLLEKAGWWGKMARQRRQLQQKQHHGAKRRRGADNVLRKKGSKKGGPAEVVKKGRSMRAGGGAFRAWISFYLKKKGQKQFCAAFLREAATEYRRLKAAGDQSLVHIREMGKLATESRRARLAAGGGRGSSNGFRNLAGSSTGQGESEAADKDLERCMAIVAHCGDTSAELAEGLALVEGERTKAFQDEGARRSQIQNTIEKFSARQPADDFTGVPCGEKAYEPGFSGISTVVCKLPVTEAMKTVFEKCPPKLIAEIDAAWADAHKLIRHEDCRKIHGQPEKISECFKAGRCLCSRSGQIEQAFVRDLRAWLRKTCSKKSVLRPLLANGTLVLELKQTGENGVSHFYHPAYSNLTTMDMSFMHLLPVADEILVAVAAAFGAKPLSVDLDDPLLGMKGLYDVSSFLDLADSWAMRAWQIRRDQNLSEIRNPSVVFISRRRLDPKLEQLWLAQAAAMKVSKARVRSVPRPPLPPMFPGADPGAPALRDEEPDAAQDDDVSRDESEEMDPCREPGEDGDEDSDEAFEDWVDAWPVRAMAEGPDIAMEPPAVVHDAGGGDAEPDPPLEADPPLAPLLDPPPPPAPPPLPPPAGIADGGEIVAVAAAVAPVPLLAGGPGWRPPRGRRAEAYPVFYFGSGYLKLRNLPPHRSMDAHCDRCGHKADRTLEPSDRTNLTCLAQGKPFGFLLLFLSVDCGGDKQRHKDVVKSWPMVAGFLYTQRADLRDSMQGRADVAEFTGAERGPHANEVRGEPFGLCGLY